MRTLALLLAAALTGACGGGAATSSSALGTVVGTVTSAPTCPVERVGSPCPPRPVAGATVEVDRGDSVVATTRTDTAGRFRVGVPAGHYTVVAHNIGGYRSTASSAVDVVAGTTATADLTVDSGIR